MVELDVVVDAVLSADAIHILQNTGGIGDGVLFCPWLPSTICAGISKTTPNLKEPNTHQLNKDNSQPKSEKIRIRPDTRIFKQAPSPTDLTTSFEHSIRVIRESFLKAISRIDATNPGSDDNHIEVVLRWSGHRQRWSVLCSNEIASYGCNMNNELDLGMKQTQYDTSKKEIQERNQIRRRR